MNLKLFVLGSSWNLKPSVPEVFKQVLLKVLLFTATHTPMQDVQKKTNRWKQFSCVVTELAKTGQLKIFVDSTLRQVPMQHFYHDITLVALFQRSPSVEISTHALCLTRYTCPLLSMLLPGLC